MLLHQELIMVSYASLVIVPPEQQLLTFLRIINYNLMQAFTKYNVKSSMVGGVKIPANSLVIYNGHL